MKKYEVKQVYEFREWFEGQSFKTKAIIQKRIDKIEQEEHFGDCKNVSKYDKGIIKDQIFELKWNDGKRVYFGQIGTKIILLLGGGNKNGQDKDITRAKRIFAEYVEGK